MKTKLTLSILMLLFIGSSFAQTSGGPDLYGYVWKSNADANGPTYNWKEIKGVGTQITGLADDNVKGPFAVNWNFRSYWNDYANFWVGSNGYISFQSTGNIAAPFPTIPSTVFKNIVCPMMCDLTFVNNASVAVPGASAWYWSNNTDSLVVQFDSVPYWVNPAPSFAGRYTFQVIFSGVDSSITFQYKVATAGTTAYSMSTEGLSTGIENSTGSIGLQVLTNVFPTAATSVKFYYPNPLTYQVHDVTPAWNQNSDNAGFFVSGPCAAPLKLKADIANAGNQTDSTISVAGEIMDAAFNTVWTGAASIPVLTQGDDTVITFSASYSANKPGDFLYKTTTTCSKDINPGNDITNVELVVADTTQDTVHLSYSTVITTATTLSWQGGNGGGGVYFIPPFYPATVVSIDYYIASNDGTAGFSAELLDDNGTANSPGTKLDSVGVPKSGIVTGAYMRVMLTAPQTITSGGVYAAWVMGGDSITLGTDDTQPLSNRNLELIGGSWASYRNNATEDLMIRLNILGSNTAMNLTAMGDTVSCVGTADGVASVAVSGGATGPFTYAWSTTPAQTTSSVSGLSAGIYTVTVTGTSACPRITTVLIESPAPMVATTVSMPDSCATCTNGYASVTAVTGGTAPYSYSWSPGGQTTTTITGFPATYTVCVTDSKGCTTCKAVTIANNTGINEITGGASVLISPNPFNSSAQVKIDFINPNQNNVFFTLFDMFGREVQSIDLREFKGSSINFTLNRGYNIPNGMYFYKLTDDKNILSAGKISVQ